MQNELPIADTTELTEREQEILKLIATGKSNKDIAQQLFISSNTVKVHLRNIFAKIGATSRTEAAVYAIHAGLSQAVESPLVEPAINPVANETKKKPLILWISILVMVLLVGAVTIIWMRSQTPKISAAGPAPVAPQRWNELARMPTARSGLAVTVYENQIYAIGGETAQGVTGVVESYDLATNKWIMLTSKPLPVTDINAAVIGGQVYIPGGRLASGKVTNILESYNPASNQWKRHTPLPVALSGYAMAAYEGKLYLFGGWDGQKFLASVYEYDPSLDKWLERTPMPTARGLEGATEAGGSIYVIGGYDGKAVLAVNEIYLPEHNTWSKGVPLPVGRYAMGVASIADIIHIIGGISDTAGSSLSLEYYPQSEHWQIYESPFVNERSHIGLVALGSYLYMLGGKTVDGYVSQSYSLRAIYTVGLPMIP